MTKERQVDELIAGDKFRETLIPRADAYSGDAPLFYGWAIMDAFLAGIAYEASRYDDIGRLALSCRSFPHIEFCAAFRDLSAPCSCGASSANKTLAALADRIRTTPKGEE